MFLIAHEFQDTWRNLPYPLVYGSHGKESACSVGDPDSIPVLGRSSGEGNGNSLGYSCLENPMAEGTSEATVCGVAKSQTRLNNFNFTFTEFRRLVVSDSL